MQKLIYVMISILFLLFAGCSNTSIALVPDNTTVSVSNDNLDTISTDIRGYQPTNTVFQDRQVGTRVPYILAQFQYNIADKDVRVETIGDGSVTQSISQAIVFSGNNANSSVLIESVNSVRYQPGAEAYALFTAAFTEGGKININQTAGLVNDNADGFFLGYVGESFIVGVLDNGKYKTYNESTFNDRLDGTGDSGCNLDKSNLIIYKISFGWLGIAPVQYEVFCGADIGWVNFATIDMTNTMQGTINSNPVLPIHMHIKKGNTLENATIKTASWNAGIVDGGTSEDKVNPASRFFSQSNTKTIGSNTLTSIITINSTNIFFGKVNRVETVLNFFSVSSEGTKPVTISILKNCDLDGTQVWVDKDVNNSVISYDITSTTITNCENIMDIQIQKEDSIKERLEGLGINLLPGETLTIAAQSATTAKIISSLRWEELF